MMDQKQFDALLDQWIEEHKQEMIDELGLWVGQKSVSRVDLGKPGAPYGPDCRKMLDQLCGPPGRGARRGGLDSL